MSAIAVTYTFSNSTVADASQVNQNFTDIINGLSDGTKDISVNAGTFAGNVSISGNTTVGNASSDDLTVTASLASTIPIKTTNSYDIGSSTLGLRALYFGANSQTVNIKGSGSMSATWTLTLPVSGGTSKHVLETDGSGTTSWVPIRTSSDDMKNIGLSTAVNASALTITLNAADGTSLSSTNSIIVNFRSATLTTGTVVERTISSNLTLTISSGSTLGQTSNKPANIYVYLIDNAGTPELAASGTLYPEVGVISTTGEGGAGAADSNTVVYSTTARSNVAFRLIAVIKNTQTTAGTWASAGTVLGVGTYGILKTNNVPTVQSFSSGSGTYYTPAGVAYIRVKMVGGGGGGAGIGATGTSGAGGTGGDTTFGTTLLSANGGTGGGIDGGAGGTGGAASLGTGPIGIALSGADGGAGGFVSTAIYAFGGAGGNSAFGGGGGSGRANTAGAAGKTNTGGGGGGAGSTGGGDSGGSGGGAGGFVDAIITNPATSYAYSVGAAGTAGTAGTSGKAGGAGGSGVIIVEEYYY